MFRSLAEALQASGVSVAIQSSTWLIPLLQAIHILMLSIVFSSVMIVALRVAGKIRMDEPLQDVWRRFRGWIWSGVVICAATGLLLIVGEPVRELTATSFWLKMALLVVALLSVRTFGRNVELAVAGGDPSPEPTGATVAAAWFTIGLWLVIIFLGRAIAYDVEVWGSWSFNSLL